MRGGKEKGRGLLLFTSFLLTLHQRNRELIMRAKEYINSNLLNLKYSNIIQQIINDLLPLRLDEKKTDEYYNKFLTPDIHRQSYLLKKELFNNGSGLQPIEPELESDPKEIPLEDAEDIRSELFNVIKEDATFGYLFFLLGNEQNLKHNDTPIDCIPNEDRIKKALVKSRDFYPLNTLDAYLDDELNYKRYDYLTMNHLLADKDEVLVEYFNSVYEVYDNIRLVKHSISEVKSYCKNYEKDSPTHKALVFEYVAELIVTYENKDSQLQKCRNEMLKTVAEELKGLKSNCDSSSSLFLSKQKGTKIDFIRVMYVLYELGMFCGPNQAKVTKKTYFRELGDLLHIDLSTYDKDFSRAIADGTALEKHLKIFEEMKNKMTEIFNSK